MSFVSEIFNINRMSKGTRHAEYERYISNIVNMLIERNTPKILYLNSLKSFGKKDGTEVYRKIKECVVCQC